MKLVTFNLRLDTSLYLKKPDILQVKDTPNISGDEKRHWMSIWQEPEGHRPMHRTGHPTLFSLHLGLYKFKLLQKHSLIQGNSHHII